MGFLGAKDDGNTSEADGRACFGSSKPSESVPGTVDVQERPALTGVVLSPRMLLGLSAACILPVTMSEQALVPRLLRVCRGDDGDVIVRWGQGGPGRQRKVLKY